MHQVQPNFRPFRDSHREVPPAVKAPKCVRWKGLQSLWSQGRAFCIQKRLHRYQSCPWSWVFLRWTGQNFRNLLPTRDWSGSESFYFQTTPRHLVDTERLLMDFPSLHKDSRSRFTEGTHIQTSLLVVEGERFKVYSWKTNWTRDCVWSKETKSWTHTRWNRQISRSA